MNCYPLPAAQKAQCINELAKSHARNAMSNPDRMARYDHTMAMIGFGYFLRLRGNSCPEVKEVIEQEKEGVYLIECSRENRHFMRFDLHSKTWRLQDGN